MKTFRNITIVLIVLIIIGYFYGSSRMLSSGDDYLPDMSVIDKIKSLEIVEKDGRLFFGQAFLEKRRGNAVLHVKGTPYEMGYQHGILLKDEISRGVVPVFADPISHEPQYRDKPAWLRKLMLKFLEYKIYAPIERNTPLKYLEELKGIADGAGLDYSTIFIANFLSDLTMAMVPGVIKGKAEALSSYMECSDFAASGSATPDGKLVFGRDTDYGGLNRWTDNQSVVFYQPEDGYAYVKVSTAGLIKCNTAMNEKGVVIGGHFMAFEGAAVDGVSFTIFENEIMRKASGIEEALALVKNTRRGGSFGLTLAESETGQALVIEATADKIGVRQMHQDTICLTNFATTDELKKADLLARHNLMMRDMAGRYARYKELIDAHRGSITVQLAAEFISDHYDVTAQRERSVGVTPGALTNVTSVVFVPDKGFFWVATGKAPACKNEYLGFDFNAEIGGTTPAVSPEKLSGYTWRNPANRRALEIYMEAFELYGEDPHDTDSVIELLMRAAELDPDEVVFDRILAQILIHEGAYKRARTVLMDALAKPQANNEKAIIHLQLGQVSDLLQDRQEALKQYKEVLALREKFGRDYLNGINDIVRAFAGKYSESPFDPKDIKSGIPVGFNLGSGLE